MSESVEFFKNLKIETRIGVCEKHGKFSVKVFAGWSGDVVCPYCEKERRDQLKALQKEKAKYADFRKIGIPKKHFESSFLNYKTKTASQKKVLQDLKFFAEKNKNKNVLCYGKSGTGKSHLLCSAVKLFQGRKLYTTWEWLDLKIRSSYSTGSRLTEERIMRRLVSFDFLAIDEIEKGTDSENKKKKLSFIFRERYENERPTWLSGNCNAEWVKTFLDESVLDRLKASGRSYCFDWESYRKNLRGE